MRTTSRFARIFGFALTVSFLTTSLPAMVASYFFLPEVDDEVVLGFNAVTTLSLSIVAELEDGLSEHDLNLVCDVVNVDGDPSTHVTIDNEPPGEPSQKTVTLVHQEPVSFSIGLIPVDSFFDIAYALRLRIHGDLNGDNVLETLATTRLSAAPPTPSLQIEHRDQSWRTFCLGFGCGHSPEGRQRRRARWQYRWPQPWSAQSEVDCAWRRRIGYGFVCVHSRQVVF